SGESFRFSAAHLAPAGAGSCPTFLPPSIPVGAGHSQFSSRVQPGTKKFATRLSPHNRKSHDTDFSTGASHSDFRWPASTSKQAQTAPTAIQVSEARIIHKNRPAPGDPCKTTLCTVSPQTQRRN